MGRGDLTDEQWTELEPLLPKEAKTGRPPVWSRRLLIDGIRFRVRTGGPWRDVPVEYGPWGRIYDLFRRWQRDGTWQRILTRLQSLADAKGLITWDLSVDSTVCRAHQHAAGARKQSDLQKEPPSGVFTKPGDHGLGRSRGGFTTKLHLAVEQGQKPMSIVITAGHRGDSPQFEPLLEKVRMPRIGPGRPRVRPDRVRADKAYASHRNHAYLRRRGIRCTSTRSTTASAVRSSAGSIASRGTALSPRDTTSSRSATRRLSSSLPSTSGCNPRPLRGGIHVPPLRQIAAAEDADEVVLAHDVVLLAVRAPPEHHLLGEARGPPEPYTVQSTGDCRPGGHVGAVTGGLIADLAHGPPVRLTHEADLAGTQNMPPPAQATCSLRRGASRSTPSVSTTKVNGSASSAAERPAIQSPNSATELIRHPPLPGRTAVFSSTGPTYR